MTRTEFLRKQTVTGANKRCRAPIPAMSVSDEPCSLAERKALALKKIFDGMPVFIGERELIVGTRTWFPANKGNEDGHSVFEYSLRTEIPYVNQKEIELFGRNDSYKNKTHFTPDFSIILHKGIDGIISEVDNRKSDPSLLPLNLDFLSAVSIAYKGLKGLILRYYAEAMSLAERNNGERREELFEIARVCKKISGARPDTFREAIQLLWFAHLGTIIESFEFVNYGRLDVILGEFLGSTPKDEAQELIDCLLLKMYDQADLVTSYLGKYAAQLVITLGGVLPNGESAVNEVTMLFLDGAGRIRLPEPELNLRISSKNPSCFLDKAAELTVSGCNFVAYYNDDLFVDNLNRAGLSLEDARNYGFDLCQDINIPGKGDFWLCCSISLAETLMELLESKRGFSNFDDLAFSYKTAVADQLKRKVSEYNEAERIVSLYAEGREAEFFEAIKSKSIYRAGNSPMAPLPLISALYHGSLESALDIAFKPHPIKAKGVFFGSAVEAINSLAAIKKRVYDENRFTLDEIYAACESDFAGDRGGFVKNILWNAPKWANDDDYVDVIAKDILEFCLRECQKYKTYHGGQIMAGIHQPHPVTSGARLMATPEGRHAGAPVAVTLTAESGTMKNGPTAALRSAAKIAPALVQWNYCVMVNYFASVFKGNGGKEIFKTLLDGYFKEGGLQHQPNVTDVEEMKKAQVEPEKYKDLIVRLWGVSAHFVDLPRELQEEMIARFE